MTRCGFKWDAPRIPTPGIPVDYGRPRPGQQIGNWTLAPQECCLREGHDGEHQSLSNVAAAREEQT